MRRQDLRVRVDDSGRIEIVDPGFDTLPLLQQIDPRFRVRARALPKFSVPRFQLLRARGVPHASMQDIRDMPLDTLWEVHDAEMSKLDMPSVAETEGALSLLDIKREIAQRLLKACCLCARRCGVDRTHGEQGVCGLGSTASVAEHFVHIAEEAPVNPSLVLNLRGCGLRCKFCQQHVLLDGAAPTGEALAPGLWDRLDTHGARSLSFVGGNPDESIPSIFDFLNTAPQDFNLPIVWNNHAYMSGEVVRLLDSVIDCYVPDFKYFKYKCAARLSGVSHYPDVAKAAVRSLLRQDVPLLVRILVLPGHIECCHLPALRWLAEADQDGNCFVSICGQYAPDWKITKRDGLMARRVTCDEVQTVVRAAQELGLRMIH